MKPAVPKLQRCAIYTRKSTEHNLDLEFNSLDAQMNWRSPKCKRGVESARRALPDQMDSLDWEGVAQNRKVGTRLLSFM
jgi:site-specific DNA recombinase